MCSDAVTELQFVHFIRVGLQPFFNAFIRVRAKLQPQKDEQIMPIHLIRKLIGTIT